MTSAADVNGDDVFDLLATVADFEQKQWVVKLFPGELDSNGHLQYQLAHRLDLGYLVSNDEESWPTASGVGDLNGDGFGDIAVSVVPTGEESSTVLVYYGSSDFRVTEAQRLASGNDENGKESGIKDSNASGFAARRLNTKRPSYLFLYSAQCCSGGIGGYVNGDGFANLLLVVPTADGFSANLPAGDVVLYLGSADGLSLVLDCRAVGEDKREAFGFGIAGAGDVNGDSYDDIIIGALIYLGGPTRWSSRGTV